MMLSLRKWSRTTVWVSLVFCLAVATLRGEQDRREVELAEDVRVRALTDHVWLHTSYCVKPEYGRIPANGLVVVDGGEAALIDLPWTDEQAQVLFKWVRDDLESEVRTVVPTHAHEDCAGGLAEAHRRGALSIALDETIRIMEETGQEAPRKAFTKETSFRCGNVAVELSFPGAGHTRDNIVAWLPGEGVLFGGCLVKASDARNLGNTADGDLAAYPDTVRRLKEAFADAETVVPGHGLPGGPKLIVHTLSLCE